MSDLDVNSNGKKEAWISSTSSRTRPLPSGQYPSSVSPQLLPAKKSADEDSNDDNSYKSQSPLTPKTATSKFMNGSKLDGEDKISGASCPPAEYSSQIRVPESNKNIVALSTKNSRHRKEAGIPVGIAVAWQRLVTSTATAPTSTNSTTMSCSGRAQSPSLLKPSKVKVSIPSPTTPKRPLTSISAPGSIALKEKGKNNHPRISELTKSRPASVNSFPIHNSGMQSKSALADQQFYGGLNSQYTDWPAGLNVPHLSPNINAAAAAAYMHHHQQMSLQQQHLQQLHLSHTQNSHYGALPLAHQYAYGSSYSPEALQKYEQYLQQAELHRHQQELHYHHQLQQHHQLQLQQHEYDIHRATSIPSPRISIPSPSPTLHSHSLWPPELFHHNSSTTLSPKSLTSTPSPVTVQDSSNFMSTTPPVYSRSRSGTPTNKALTPMSPPTTREGGWRELKITPVPKAVKKCDAIDCPPAIDLARMEEEVREEKLMPLPLVVDRKRHDFTRMESLIERRDEVSVPLLKPDQDEPVYKEHDRKSSSCSKSKVNKYDNPGKNPKSSAIDNPNGLSAKNPSGDKPNGINPTGRNPNGVEETEIKEVKPCDVEVGGVIIKQVPDESRLNLFPFVPVKVEPVDSNGNNSSSGSRSSKSDAVTSVKPLFNHSSSSTVMKKDTGSLETLHDNNNKLRDNSSNYLSIKTERRGCNYFDTNPSNLTSVIVSTNSNANSTDKGGSSTKAGVIAVQPYKPTESKVKALITPEKVEPQVRETSCTFPHQQALIKPEPVTSVEELKSLTSSLLVSSSSTQPNPLSTSLLDVKQIKQEPQPSQDSIDNPGIPLVGGAKLHPKIETNFILTKCDTDIKVTAVKPLSIFSSCSLLGSDHSSLDPSISQSVKEESSQAQLFVQYQQQQQQQQQQQPQQHLLGNRSYHVLNVPLPPPPPPSPLSSTDRKLLVKAELDSLPTTEHSILTHHRFHHNFLPIEEENNHLDLLATVAQEFGNEIGLIKPHRRFSHTFDTYEFKEEPVEKIDPFGHQHVLSSEQSKQKSNATPVPEVIPSQPTLPSPPSVSSTSLPSSTPPASLTSPSVPTSSAPPLPPIVLRIPQIKPTANAEKVKTKVKKAKAKKKKEKVESREEKEGKGGRKKKRKHSKVHSKEMGSKYLISSASSTGEKSKSKKIYGGESSITMATNVITDAERRKWKKQMIAENTLEPVCESKQQLKVAPLKLTKRRSTTDAIVMKKGTGNRSLGNKIKMQRYSVETSVPYVWSQSQWQTPAMMQDSEDRVRGKLPNENSNNVNKSTSNSTSSSCSISRSSLQDKPKETRKDGLETIIEEGQSVKGTEVASPMKPRKMKKPRKSEDRPSEKSKLLSQKPNALSQDLKKSSLQSKHAKNPKRKKEKLAKHSLKVSKNTSSVSYSSCWSSSKELPEGDNSLTDALSLEKSMEVSKEDITPPLAEKQDTGLFSPATSTSSNLENDWAANPAYAVTAIKTDSPILSPCNTDTTSSPDRNLQRKVTKPSKLTLMNFNNNNKDRQSDETLGETNNHDTKSSSCTDSSKITTKVKSNHKSFVHFAPRRAVAKATTNGHRHIKPSLKAEPVIRRSSTPSPSPEHDFLPLFEEKEEVGIENIDINTETNVYSPPPISCPSPEVHVFPIAEIPSETMTSFNDDFSQIETTNEPDEQEEEEDLPDIPDSDVPDNPKVEQETVVLKDVSELLNDMRILTEIQGLFYTGKLNALQPPDVYGVTLDNERGAPPHIIFSAEEVLEKCIREMKPTSLEHGFRVCAYWSPQYSGLYPGKISADYIPSGDPQNDLIPIEFDDGDTGVIKLNEIRLLASDHPIREYDPNPLLTLEKKHRKRRHSSAAGSQSGCTGDHEEADCGEPYCAKVGKFEEEDSKEKVHSSKVLYWTWHGLGFKRSRSKKDRNKEFFDGIQRGDEIIKVGDSALFISSGNDRPFIGRVEKFWEKKGQKVVKVRWYYHPDEVKSKRIQGLYTGALFESPHIDENDVQTIARKCDVMPFEEFKEKVGCLTKWSRSTSQRGTYYVTGFYDPYTYNLKLKDLK